MHAAADAYLETCILTMMGRKASREGACTWFFEGLASACHWLVFV